MTFSTSRVGEKTEEVVLREPTPPLVPPAMLSSQSLPTALDKDKLAKLLSVACSMCKPMIPAPRSVFSCFAFADTTLCCRCFEWGDKILELRTDADTVNSHFMWWNLGEVPSLSNGTTARGGPRPPWRVSSILPGLGRLLSSFCTLALLHLLSLHLPNAEHSRSLTKIHSFSNVFYSVSCLVVVLPSVRFSLC